MLQATVVGHVWATKRIDGLPNGAFLEVEVEGSGDRLVAFDVLGSGHGLSTAVQLIEIHGVQPEPAQASLAFGPNSFGADISAATRAPALIHA